MSAKPIIAVTAGDVSGIGPEIIVRALAESQVQNSCCPIVICQPAILQQAVNLCGFSSTKVVTLPDIPSRQELLAKTDGSEGTIFCHDPMHGDTTLPTNGAVSAAAGDAAFQYLSAAIALAKAKQVDAIATAPLNKAALHAAGHHFPGHTEILAEQCNVDDFAMMLHLSENRIAPLRKLVATQSDSFDATSGLSIAHVTLHTPIESVPQKLTVDGIQEKIQLMHDFLDRIGCVRKSIAVCALNPHGGEQGLFGSEESQFIEPAVKSFADTDVRVTGPLPVDTLIRRAVTGEFDGVVAMYHDQGHIPIKLMGFDSAVNITLGLPIVRTSPTHGTAFDRAWNTDSPADPSGMIEAILTAVQLCGSAAACEQ